MKKMNLFLAAAAMVMVLAGGFYTSRAQVNTSMDVAEEDYSSYVTSIDSSSEDYSGAKNDTTQTQPQPSQPSQPSQPTQPAQPAETVVKTEYIYVPVQAPATEVVKTPAVEETTVKASKPVTKKVTKPVTPHINVYSAKGSVVVSVKGKPQAGVAGYEICVSYNKIFAGTTVVKTTGVSKKITMKPGKRVYVKVRAYKKINGKVVYSKWSTTSTAVATK